MGKSTAVRSKVYSVLNTFNFVNLRIDGVEACAACLQSEDFDYVHGPVCVRCSCTFHNDCHGNKARGIVVCEDCRCTD